MPFNVLSAEPDARAPGRLKSIALTSLTVVALSTFESKPTRAATMQAPPVSINGVAISGDALERQNTVAAQGYFEKLGAKVTSSDGSFVAKMGGNVLARLSIGNRHVVVNGTPHTSSTAPFIASGVAILPLRSIGGAAGAHVAYAADPRAVNITRDSPAIAAGGAAAAATVAQAAVPAPTATTDTSATNAPAAAVADTNASGIPWWLWALIALSAILLIVWRLSRRKKEPIITTSGSARKRGGNDPTIDTRK